MKIGKRGERKKVPREEKFILSFVNPSGGADAYENKQPSFTAGLNAFL